MSPNRERYRVIQWATGSIGQIAIRREQPDLRAGRRLRDERRQARNGAGEVAGIAPLGLVCTTDKQSILALDADCVNYAPLYYDVDEMCAILRSGKNLVRPPGLPTRRRAIPTRRPGSGCLPRGRNLAARRGHPSGLHRRRVRADRCAS